jgi:hypothetical protein
MIGKTVTTMAKFTATFLAGTKGPPSPGPSYDMAGTKASPTCTQVK